MIRPDPAVAECAGLTYVTDAEPGITRERRKDGWVYRRPDGRVITDPRERARIDAIGVPRAWTDVWISPIPDGHILATGRDSRSRKQYIYHPCWRELRDRAKFHRVEHFGRALPGVRRRIEHDMDLPGLPREKVLGAVLRLMDMTLIRIGNDEYARQNQHYGLTTLRHDHVRFDDPTTVMFEFRAKSGKEQRVRLSDPRLAEIVYACHELPGQKLFAYIDDAGRVVHIGSADVNAYLREITRATFTAKDFRTWGGTVTAADALVHIGPARSPTDAKRKINKAIDAAAERLNNTRAVCRKNYVDPRVPDAYLDGSLPGVVFRARKRPRLSRPESGVLLLAEERPLLEVSAS
ncbi:MAG: topoisomerase [Mycobacterium sp.]|nr:topoisomerase [Mycobacterium sp.]